MLRRVRVQARVRRRSIEDTGHAKSQGDPRVHTERPPVVHETLHNSSGPPIVFQLSGAQFVCNFQALKKPSSSDRGSTRAVESLEYFTGSWGDVDDMSRPSD